MIISREDEWRLINLDTIMYEALRQIEKRIDELTDNVLKEEAAQRLEEFNLLHMAKKFALIP